MGMLFAVIYLLFICGVAFTSFFIVTNLHKYSINPRFTQPIVSVYIIITVALVVVNIVLFVSIPFSELFYNNSLY